MAKIHYRMPLILYKNGYGVWFDAKGRERIEPLMEQISEDRIELKTTNRKI